MNKKTILVILDGWGFGDKSKSDVISQVETPYWDSLLAKYPYSQLEASGENVGLPDGQMGNSEVGHLNIGAGRVVYQDLVKINRACADGSIADNKALSEAYAYAKENGKKVHLLGLMSKGGVHSSQAHIHTLLDVANKYGLNDVFVHAFMDGRDTDPRSGKGFMTELLEHMDKSTGSVATVTGRYYAMDRDNRWERVKEAYDVMVDGIGTKSEDLLASIQASYDAEVTDEFIKPIVNSSVDGKIAEGDVVVFFNFRNDRAKELTIALTQKDLPEHGMKTIPLHYCTMTPYDAKFEGLHILFDKENVKQTIGEVVSNAGLKQLRIAETEKYAHVTFFFSGGREEVFPGEDRILVNSPKVATYDLQPEMSAFEVKDKVVAELNDKKYDFICLNFANGDMVGHTGVYDAIQKAVKAVDDCVEGVVEAAKENGYEAIIIADHGNADNAVNADGSANTAHSLNPVPFVWITEQNGKTVNGVLADVAPSILELMGVDQPESMTGKSLIKLS
ncbi:2,3-bisphosphoglycerate-independent phosphoglycerate mutase [Carboxylicivirga sp. N1Y90]|uniref:2,3-bisphosphoglycerate-independent phosphoglycerate mutase n=1 Tax=Carboxylicivirga fragile TaxID=3417571 RepID=UPI003D347C5E|nr:2,3-bisphosphoglycerate-independent phosphoglycerate mutase [Marinilabiliaceae bacterium N1Y90]